MKIIINPYNSSTYKLYHCIIKFVNGMTKRSKSLMWWQELIYIYNKSLSIIHLSFRLHVHSDNITRQRYSQNVEMKSGIQQYHTTEMSLNQDGTVVHKHKTRFTQQKQLQQNVKVQSREVKATRSWPIQGDPGSMILSNPGSMILAKPGRSRQHYLVQSRQHDLGQSRAIQAALSSPTPFQWLERNNQMGRQTWCNHKQMSRQTQ